MHDDLYSAVLPKQNRLYSDQINIHTQNVKEKIDHTDLQNNQEHDNSSPIYSNRAMCNNIYGKVMPKHKRKKVNLQNENVKEDNTKLQNNQKRDMPEASYSNQGIHNDIYSEVVPKSRRSQIYVNSRGYGGNNVGCIDLEPMYSEPKKYNLCKQKKKQI